MMNRGLIKFLGIDLHARNKLISQVSLVAFGFDQTMFVWMLEFNHLLIFRMSSILLKFEDALKSKFGGKQGFHASVNKG